MSTALALLRPMGTLVLKSTVSLSDASQPQWAALANDLVVNEKVRGVVQAGKGAGPSGGQQGPGRGWGGTMGGSWSRWSHPNELLISGRCSPGSLAGAPGRWQRARRAPSTARPLCPQRPNPHPGRRRDRPAQTLVGSRCGPMDMALALLASSPDVGRLLRGMVGAELRAGPAAAGAVERAAEKGMLKVQVVFVEEEEEPHGTDGGGTGGGGGGGGQEAQR